MPQSVSSLPANRRGDCEGQTCLSTLMGPLIRGERRRVIMMSGIHGATVLYNGGDTADLPLTLVRSAEMAACVAARLDPYSEYGYGLMEIAIGADLYVFLVVSRVVFCSEFVVTVTRVA